MKEVFGSGLKLGAFILGGLLVVNNAPEFVIYAVRAFQEENIGGEVAAYDKYTWMLLGIRVVFGFILITQESWLRAWVGIKMVDEEKQV